MLLSYLLYIYIYCVCVCTHIYTISLTNLHIYMCICVYFYIYIYIHCIFIFLHDLAHTNPNLMFLDRWDVIQDAVIFCIFHMVLYILHWFWMRSRLSKLSGVMWPHPTLGPLHIHTCVSFSHHYTHVLGQQKHIKHTSIFLTQLFLWCDLELVSSVPSVVCFIQGNHPGKTGQCK